MESKTFAIITDIHSNLASLKKSLSIIYKKDKIDQIICLGDCFALGPEPEATLETLKEIKSHGHEVGLHFDPTVYNVSDELSMSEHIKKEASALSDIIGAPISMFSFHNTTDFTRNCRAQAYSGLVNAYSNFFHNDVEYTSDSNGYWRFRTWKELLLENHKIIQVLTHPIWWEPKNEFPPLETVVKKSDSLRKFSTKVTPIPLPQKQ